MKRTFQFVSCLLLMMLAMSLCIMPISAAETGYISGDCRIFLPKSGTIKLTYKLLTAEGGTEVSGAAWSLIGDNAADNIGSYAYVNAASGELYISADAPLGESFRLKAETANYTAEKLITIHNVKYWTDFEDAEQVKTIFGSGFDTSLIQTEDNGNHYAAFTGGAWGIMNNTVPLTAENLATSSLNIEARFRTTGTAGTATGGDLYAMRVLYNEVSLNINDTTHTFSPYFNIYRSVEKDGLYPITSHYWYSEQQDTVISTYRSQNSVKVEKDIFNTYKWTIRGGVSATRSTQSLTVNNQTALSNYQMFQFDMNLDTVPVKEFNFYNDTDDIEIYSGEKASGTYSVLGEEKILLAPEGRTAAFTYTATPVLPWAEAADDIIWSVKENYSGVTFSEGKLLVSGSAARGSFTVQAKVGDTVIGEKKVTIIPTSPWSAVTDKTRAYRDFEELSEGKLATENNPYPNAIRVENLTPTDYSEGSSVVKINGKTYIEAKGRVYWSKDGTTLGVNIRDCAQMNYSGGNLEIASSSATIETNVKLNNAIGEHTAWSLLYLSQNGIDLRYQRLSDTLGGIYLYRDINGENTELISVMPFDACFNLRLYIDFAKKTYDAYINDRLVLGEEACTLTAAGGLNSTARMGCLVDDFAVYNGDKVSGTPQDLALTFYEDGAVKSDAAFGDKFVFTEAAEAKSISVGFSKKDSGLTAADDARLIFVFYDKNGKVTAVGKNDVVVTAQGMTVGAAGMTQSVEAGSYAKVFLWNKSALQPLTIR